MAGDPRRIAEQALTHHGLHAVAAKQNIGGPVVAFVIKDGHLIGGLANIHHRVEVRYSTPGWVSAASHTVA